MLCLFDAIPSKIELGRAWSWDTVLLDSMFARAEVAVAGRGQDRAGHLIIQCFLKWVFLIDWSLDAYECAME